MKNEVCVFTIVSEAMDMLEYSSQYAIENAGMDFDYLVVLWNESPEVADWVKEKGFSFVHYITDPKLSFIANLRNCFNLGFETGYKTHNLVVPINTDNMFYYNWLKNLHKNKSEDAVVNCKLIEPGTLPSIHITRDFGITNKESFKLKEFYDFCFDIYENGRDKLLTAADMGKRPDATPYILPKVIWDKCGPWELEPVDGVSPDVRFFDRITGEGFKNLKAMDAISYHVGQVETRRMQHE